MNAVRDALVIRLAEIQGKRKARQGQSQYAVNIEEIDAAIAQIETELARIDAEDPPT